jgi:hypothetical protein
LKIHPNIIADLKVSIDALLAQYPELSDDAILRADMFEAETKITDILNQLVDLEGESEAWADALEQRIELLENRRSRVIRRKDAVRSLIQSIMERADLKKVVLTEATLSSAFRKPSPVILNDEALTDDLCKFKRIPDMEKIKAVIADGVMPAGVSMGNGRQILTIRRS